MRTFKYFLIVLLGLPAFALAAPFDYEEQPIRYSATPPADPVAELQRRIDDGRVKLEFNATHGYLPSVLKNLNIPTSSQSLVFSKTSFQRNRIAPNTPRALYFNDDVYIGWVQGGDVVEVAAIDPKQGTQFYVLKQRELARPKFLRQTHECLQCHDSSAMTGGVPGVMIRSVFPDEEGQPILSAGTYISTQRSPWKERWGGWYVSGKHGAQMHMGNLCWASEQSVDKPNLEQGANQTDLSSKFSTSAYLSPHSDIVALMILAHQAQLHNLLTRAQYEARIAARYETELNAALGRPAGERLQSTISRIEGVADPLVRYILFCDEPKLSAAVEGCSSYAGEFSKLGPRDAKGRSLRDLDLRTRMFKYPCSFLIYSDQFEALPPLVKDVVYQKLFDVLTGKSVAQEYSHLSAADRTAILEILRATRKGLPEYWHNQTSKSGQ